MADTIRPDSQIGYSVADRTATITLSRPDQLNAFTQVMRDELIDAFDPPDVAEGVSAFLEKRPLRFPMRLSTDLPDLGPRWPEPPGYLT